ncbi:MAG TPA: nucleotidyl transferase AbiEii/AbiGii toxin family protein [Pyrinomonadaceae bacterium]|nr:nucleotidyl transferase AbiEii/AbiGii toxin family protein [Pyrinomonadaceae bacterium]
MNKIFQAAAEVQDVCQSQGWQFCFIGGLALQRWGEPRETVDVDLSLLAGFGREEQFSEVLLKHFEPRISNAVDFAQQRRVLLLRSTKGVGLDVALAALPFEELMIQRSSYFDYRPGLSLRTCSAEDLIVLKAFAGRAQDWVDVERTIVRQTGLLDWDYIREQLGPLAELKEAPEIIDQLEARRVEFER